MNPSSFYMAKARNSPTGGGGARDPHKGRYKIISLSLTKIDFFLLDCSFTILTYTTDATFQIILMFLLKQVLHQTRHNQRKSNEDKRISKAPVVKVSSLYHTQSSHIQESFTFVLTAFLDDLNHSRF